MSQPRKRCKDCDKFWYTAEETIRAALGTARTTGKATRFYRCPADNTRFHVTTKKKRGI